MESEFTAEKTRRLVETILQAMKEGWSPGSDAAHGGAWRDKQAEARFAAAFQELVQCDSNDIATAVADETEIQHLSDDVFFSMRKRDMCRHVVKRRVEGARVIGTVG